MRNTGLVLVESLSISGDFASDASIVLIGARGTGKSSLAIIAWSSFRLKHIDVDQFFLRKTRLTRSAFRKENGAKECREQEVSILTELLDTHSKGCVIVCPPGCVEEEAALLLLKQYAQTHPVIHVTRSPNAVQEYLKAPDPSKFNLVLELRNRVYRACSNFEFYNLDEEEVAHSTTSIIDGISRHGSDINNFSPQSLRLKRMEESFVHFVKKVLHPAPPVQHHGGRFPLPPSRSSYSYLLSVSLSQVNARDFKVEWLDCGADACQLEIDVLAGHERRSTASVAEEISRAFAILTRFFDGPTIYHVRLPPASSELEGQYLDLLHHGFRLGADYLTVDLRCSSEKVGSLMTYQGFTKLIGDFHDENPGTDGWSRRQPWDMYHKVSTLGLDGIRMTQVATNTEDNSAAVSFTFEAGRLTGRQPFLIVYNTGALGRTSRCYNQVLTPVTTAELMSRDSKDPEMMGLDAELTIQSAQNALYAMFVYDPMQYYIIGVDVSYSLSPPVHNAAHRFFGMPHSLSRRSMSSLEGMQELVHGVHFGGISIAQGFKMSVFPFVSALSTHARNIGAINSLIPIRSSFFEGARPPPLDFWANRNRAGPVLGLYGENTDWVGMTRCVLRNLSPANAITPRTTALIIGAGGMARAALYSLLQLGVLHIMVYNRTPVNARSLADHFNTLDNQRANEISRSASVNGDEGDSYKEKAKIRVLESLEAEWCTDLAQPTIFISCIPASKVVEQPGADFTLPLQWMKSPTGGVVVDLNYRPLVTPLLHQVRQQAHRGWVAVDGLENLAAQASAQFELFTGRKVPQNLMRVAALQNYHTIHDDDAEAREVIRSKLMQLQGVP